MKTIKVDSKTSKLEKIHTIQKYQTSPRFGNYVKKTLKINHTESKLEKMTDKKLDDILNKIRLYLDNRNMDVIYNNMAKSLSKAAEMTITPFYDIDGFSNNLLSNEDFWNSYERFKIEQKMPTIPPSVQLLYVVSATMLMTHQQNKSLHKPPTKIEQVKEMEPPEVEPDIEMDIEPIVKELNTGDVI